MRDSEAGGKGWAEAREGMSQGGCWGEKIELYLFQPLSDRSPKRRGAGWVTTGGKSDVGKEGGGKFRGDWKNPC